ncbi:ClpX C4-type zinc finger protein [Nonomuraea sp. NPDC048916]|uniref:ClpX C4-type zinc finger protein n=1 Tax=Nonomuraea sp. NPDC048916 TaxID=3154232 RepID=UPI0033D4861F
MTRSKGRRRVTPVEEVATRCSFCGMSHAEAKRVVAGPGVYICDACIELAHRLLSDPPQGSEPQRAHRGPDPEAEWLPGMSDDDLLASLPRHALTIEQAERDLRAWVRILRDRGVTWARIGQALGISRQAAWDRFAADVEDR